MLIKRVQERMSSHTVLDGRGYGEDILIVHFSRLDDEW